MERVEEGTTLVDHARDTMNAVVGSIQRVTDIVDEISAAGAEQCQGVGQAGEAVKQMDPVTQQNAALLEQSASAAESLQRQARATGAGGLGVQSGSKQARARPMGREGIGCRSGPQDLD